MKLSRAISLASCWMQGHVVTLRDGEAREYHKLCHEALKWMRERESAKNAHYNCCKKANSSWISVEDRLPEKDERVLCRYTFGKDGRMYFYQVLDYYATDPQPHFQHTLGAPRMRVTHWMPLPEPLEVEG